SCRGRIFAALRALARCSHLEMFASHKESLLPGAKITALGCYVPPDLLTNSDLEKIVETNNEWILDRTGIIERHIAPAHIATSDLAVEAARAALSQRGVSPGELDAIIVCTVTP